MKTYMERKKTISDMLVNIPRTLDVIEQIDDNSESDFLPSRNPRDSRQIYLDFKIYTVILDEEGNYEEVINHTSNDNFDEEKIKKEIISHFRDDFHIKFAAPYEGYDILITNLPVKIVTSGHLTLSIHTAFNQREWTLLARLLAQAQQRG